MGYEDPETLLGLIAAAGFGLLILALLIRSLTRPRTGATSDADAAVPRRIDPAKPQSAPRPIQATPPQASPPAPRPSYTAVAAAQASPLTAKAAEPPSARIDYSTQPLGVPPGSSYTAIAVATHQR
ncbi:hypothetical protein [uncultured Hyphomicrobium sp.]|uniref:hypothetical protein n=1 Tax=uncultured Hyphomicrobium sp. TaxID=194373 RepID=UPI0025FACEB8|nr:hypothetical protein [uncultured Hyphomicrobium sp.]